MELFRLKIYRSVVLLVCLVACSQAIGQSRVGIRFDLNNSNQIEGIHFWGSADWLVSQQSEKAKWHKFEHLSSITLSHTKVTREQLKYISSLRRVTDLSIGPDWVPEEIEIAGKSLAPLWNMNWLESLELTDDGFDDEDYFFLGGLTNLNYLHIGGVIRQQTFSQISKLKKLQEFSCQGIGMIDINDASRFVELPSLQNVSLGFVKNKSASQLIIGLFRNKNLRQLELHCEEITNQQLALLGNSENLRHLDLSGLKGLDGLSLNNSKQLEFLRLKLVGPMLVKDLSFISECKHIQFLSLSGVQISLDGIETLSNFKQLEHLSLQDVELSDRLIRTVSRLPNLHYLNVQPSRSSMIQKARTQLPRVKLEFSRKPERSRSNGTADNFDFKRMQRFY